MECIRPFDPAVLVHALADRPININRFRDEPNTCLLWMNERDMMSADLLFELLDQMETLGIVPNLYSTLAREFVYDPHAPIRTKAEYDALILRLYNTRWGSVFCVGPHSARAALDGCTGGIDRLIIEMFPAVQEAEDLLLRFRTAELVKALHFMTNRRTDDRMALIADEITTINRDRTTEEPYVLKGGHGQGQKQKRRQRRRQRRTRRRHQKKRAPKRRRRTTRSLRRRPVIARPGPVVWSR